MKDEVRQIIGKRIRGVVIKENEKIEGGPRSQLFLVFEDDTYYEFYSFHGELCTTGGVCKGTLDDAMKYMSPTMRPVWVGYRGARG